MDTDQKKIYFISDIHLGTPDDKERLQRLRSFFEHIQKDAAALYILGDYFDFWFEYRHTIPKACIPGVHLLMQLAEYGSRFTISVEITTIGLMTFLNNKLEL